MYCTFQSCSHKLSSLHHHRSAIILAVSMWNSNQVIFLQPPFPKTLKADDEIFIVCLQWSQLGQMLSYFTRWLVQKDNFCIQHAATTYLHLLSNNATFLGRGSKVQTCTKWLWY